jgi:hypothetical protein
VVHEELGVLVLRAVICVRVTAHPPLRPLEFPRILHECELRLIQPPCPSSNMERRGSKGC